MKSSPAAFLSLITWFFLPTFVPSGFAYYPGSPDRNLSVLQTAEITENKHLFSRFNHRFKEPVLPVGESDPFYHLFGLDGGASIYMDVALGLANLGEVTLFRQQELKIYGLEGKVQLWNQRVDKKPLNVAVTGNTQVRTFRSLADEDRWSMGGSLVLTRSFLRDRFEGVVNGLFQSNANTEANSSPENPQHSVALGLGVVARWDRYSFFAEYVIPVEMDLGGWGYVRESQTREGTVRGAPMQAYGFNYRIWYHSFELFVGNTYDVAMSEYISGAIPSSERVNEWRLGFNLTRTFKLMH